MLGKKVGTIVERTLAVLGLLLVGQFLLQSFSSTLSAKQAVSQFAQAQTIHHTPSSNSPDGGLASGALTATTAQPVIPTPTPDQSSWSQSARDKFASLPPGDAPIAVISVPGLDLDVPVYAGVSEDNLDRGAAWVEYTADPREQGNIGIAGHRDAWFRPLKDIQIGDHLTLQTLEGRDDFVVTDMQIVTPDNTSVLHDTADKTVTLITCYPFYFIGSAPERLVVRAKLLNPTNSGD